MTRRRKRGSFLPASRYISRSIGRCRLCGFWWNSWNARALQGRRDGMKPLTAVLSIFLLLSFTSSPLARAQADVDWQKARSLLVRERQGEKLSPDEQAYLDHAK